MFAKKKVFAKKRCFLKKSVCLLVGKVWEFEECTRSSSQMAGTQLTPCGSHASWFVRTLAIERICGKLKKIEPCLLVLSHLSHVSILFLVKYDKTETN